MSGLPVVHVPMECVEVCPAWISGRKLFVGKPRVSVVVLPRAAGQDLLHLPTLRAAACSPIPVWVESRPRFGFSTGNQCCQ